MLANTALRWCGGFYKKALKRKKKRNSFLTHLLLLLHSYQHLLVTSQVSQARAYIPSAALSRARGDVSSSTSSYLLHYFTTVLRNSHTLLLFLFTFPSWWMFPVAATSTMSAVFFTYCLSTRPTIISPLLQRPCQTEAETRLSHNIITRKEYFLFWSQQEKETDQIQSCTTYSKVVWNAAKSRSLLCSISQIRFQVLAYFFPPSLPAGHILQALRIEKRVKMGVYQQHTQYAMIYSTIQL